METQFHSRHTHEPRWLSEVYSRVEAEHSGQMEGHVRLHSA